MIAMAEGTQIKALFKEALVELIQERKDLFVDLLSEALEDVGLMRAISAGRAFDYVSRADIMAILDDSDASPF